MIKGQALDQGGDNLYSGKKNSLLFLMIATLSLKSISIGWALDTQAILPVPDLPNSYTSEAKLGKKLYNDTLFSTDDLLSCASCHSLSKGGADGLPKYIGKNKKSGMLNTPTVLNATLNFRQFWNGRAKTIEEVIDDHVADPTIFANQWEIIVKKTQEKYKNKITSQEIKDALKQYLQHLLTPNSPFDRYLKGDKNALTTQAQEGYRYFQEYGCITCHQGPNIGGNLYEKFGVYQSRQTQNKNISVADLGLYSLTSKEADKFVFKVPSLRNIALTAPYFHDGSAKTLEEAIRLMGIYQVGRPIPDGQVPLIQQFLESLTGVIKDDD